MMMMTMMMMQVLKSEKVMILKIDRVFPQHFRKYYFHAHNEAGSDEVELVLNRRGKLSLCTYFTRVIKILHAVIFFSYVTDDVQYTHFECLSKKKSNDIVLHTILVSVDVRDISK